MNVQLSALKRGWPGIVLPMLVLLSMAGSAHAQVTVFGIDWFSFVRPDWVDSYQQDDATGELARMAEIPDVFGDSFARGGDIVAMETDLSNSTSVILAGGRGLKPSEINKALPMNRVYFAYNHFHNAAPNLIDDTLGGVMFADDVSIDRYTLGLESRFCDGLWSVELRMPFFSSQDITFVGANATVENRAGNAGNLSVLLKRLVYYDRCTSCVIGLGVETPTGSDYFSRTGRSSIDVSNDAVHLVPYIGLLRTPNERRFFHAWAELDVAANGNRIISDEGAGRGIDGKFDDQTLLYVDVSSGYWLHRDPCARLLTGLAALAEFHYTTTLESSDTVTAAPRLVPFTVSNLANRVDVLNVTAAIHLEFANDTSLRVGGVFPVTAGDDRFFDAEVAAQLIRRF